MDLWRIAALLLMFPAHADLPAGRAALARHDVPAALQAYSSIGYGDPLYPDKLEDLVRFAINDQQNTEAWRILQVAHRLGRSRSEWNDYERLALFQAQSCPLAIQAFNPAHGDLLDAATYRLLPRMFLQPTLALERAQDNEILTRLTPGVTPYLEDIPNTHLLPDRGCRFAKVLVRHPRGLMKAELAALLAFLDGRPADHQAKLLVLMRALDLASRPEVNDKRQIRELTAKLPAAREMPWALFPDPEKQWLFVKLFGGGRRSEIPAELRSAAQDVAFEALFAEGSNVNWLAAIDVAALPAGERVRVFTRAATLGPFIGRGWVLLQLAEAHHALGETTDTLTLLRRLLVENEEPLDDPAQDEAVDLAAHIFAEQKLDQRTIGALQAALPARMWFTLLEQTRLRAALAGQRGEYARLESMHSRLRPRSGPKPAQWKLAEALAARNLRAFTKQLAEFKRYGTGKLLEFTRKIATYLVEDSATYHSAGVVPFLHALTSHLRSLSYPGAPNAEEIDDLYQLLNSAPSEWNAGQQDVREGVVKLGAVKWRRSAVVPQSFAIHPPAVLPLRELIYVPDLTTERGWKFSTVVR